MAEVKVDRLLYDIFEEIRLFGRFGVCDEAGIRLGRVATALALRRQGVARCK